MKDFTRVMHKTTSYFFVFSYPDIYLRDPEREAESDWQEYMKTASLQILECIEMKLFSIHLFRPLKWGICGWHLSYAVT